MKSSLATAFAAFTALVLGTSTTAAAAAGPAWLAARASLKTCLTEAEAGERARCLESAARALDAAEADGQGPVPTPQQARREAERSYGLHEGARQAQVQAQLLAQAPARPPRAPKEPAAGLVTVVARANLDASGNWVMTTREGAVWAQTDGTMVSRPPGPGSTLAVRPGALGSYFCLINDRREVRCRRRS